MRSRISSRWRDRLLIGGIVAAQALLLAVGWILTFNYTHRRVSAAVGDVILTSNVQFAESLSQALGEVDGDLKIGDTEWERVQTVVESMTLPAAGFACILNEDGYIIAHPDFRGDPTLGEITLADHPFLVNANGEELALFEFNASKPVMGQMHFIGDGVHYVVTQQLNDTGYRMMVHQPVGGLTAVLALVTSGLLATAALIGLLILVPTGLLSWFAVRRHQRALRSWNAELEAEVQRRLEQFTRSRDALIMGLAKLADYRDNETGGHLERICTYSVMLAEALREQCPEIDDDWVNQLRLAASMHDIGKVGVPDAVLLKPGKLTDDEYAVIKTHPQIGADTLIAIRDKFDNDPLIDMSIAVTLGHHERWDGGGYPLQVAGDTIPLAARIVAVADVYDALTVKRVYKPAMSHDRAAQIIQEGRGTQFDPAVVDAFLRIQDKFRSVSESMHEQTGKNPESSPAKPLAA